MDSPHGRPPTFLRAGCDRKTSALAGAVTGSVVLWVAAASGLLYFDNFYGPLRDSQQHLGRIAGFGSGLLAGVIVFVLTWWIARRSRVLLIVLVGVVCASAWVLLPRQIDVSESFVPQSNARWTCTGWSFLHYPPDTYDANAITYCVGFEERIADG